MLEAGISKKWSIILEEYTGSKEISARSLIKYFAPLIKWLKEERLKKKYSIGWDENLTSSYGKTVKSNMFLVFLISLFLMNIFL